MKGFNLYFFSKQLCFVLCFVSVKFMTFEKYLNLYFIYYELVVLCVIIVNISF